MNRLLMVEYSKLRRSGICWIAVLVPLFLVFQGVVNFVRYRDTMFAKSTRTEWEILYEQCIIMYPTLLLPLVITILIALMARIEHSQNGWKQLLALPVSRTQVYSAKLIMACIVVLINLSVLSISTLVGGMVIGVEGEPPYALLISRGVLAFIAVLPVVAIQFVLSFRFSHVGIPLALGTGLAVPTIFVANSERFWMYDPWTYPVMVYFGPAMEEFKKGMLLYGGALVIFSVIILLGLQEFKRRDMV